MLFLGVEREGFVLSSDNNLPIKLALPSIITRY